MRLKCDSCIECVPGIVFKAFNINRFRNKNLIEIMSDEAEASDK